jgi:DNA-binding response OmpR family regulator
MVLVAERPLTLDEANYALTLATTEGRPTSHAELQENVWKGDFKSTVRNIYGLFISVYNSKLFFIH